MPYPAGYGFPLPLGCRHSLLDPSHSRWRFGPSLRSAYCRLAGRLHRGLHVPHEGDTFRGGCLLCAGATGVRAEDYAIPQTRCDPISAYQPRVLLTSPNDTYIQRFTFVHPSELRLARVACLVQTRLGHFGQLHTGPLPAPHVPDGDRVEHYSELSITTPLKRLRVAPYKGDSSPLRWTLLLYYKYS
jgi:hypothetical protein